MSDSTYAIVDLAPVATATYRGTVPVQELGGLIGTALPAILQALGEQGRQPAGAWYTRHHSLADVQAWDVEIGFPVDQPITAAGMVEPGTLGGGRTAQALYTGPYEGLADAWQGLRAWAGEQGLQQDGPTWEEYLVGPETTQDPAGFQTRLSFPLR